MCIFHIIKAWNQYTMVKWYSQSFNKPGPDILPYTEARYKCQELL